MTIFGGGRESICSQMDKILNGSTTTTFTEASPPLRRHTCARIFREIIFTKYFAKLIFTKNYYLFQISNRYVIKTRFKYDILSSDFL